MINYFFLSTYFKDLYPLEEQYKFDLFSESFYADAMAFYCKKIGEADRPTFIKGFEYLSVKIKSIEEIDLILEVWEICKHYSFGSEMFCVEKPNPYSEFKMKVSNVLVTKKEGMVEKENSFRIRLIEKSKNDKIIIGSLLRDKRANNNNNNNNIQSPIGLDVEIQTPTQCHKIDFTELIKRIRFDKDEVTKKRVKDNLIQLVEVDYFTTCNAKEFAAVALIFFQTGWVINTSTFKEWKSIFAKAFNRENSTYKAGQLNENMELMKVKIPFLDKVPIK